MAALLVAILAGFALDRAYPPDLSRLSTSSVAMLDRDGRLLRAFKTADQQWRFPVDPAAVSPNYLHLLLSTEDRRFGSHPGVDPLALLRAAWQVVTRGRVVSGASTLAMQVARLLEPRPRTLRSKFIEIGRALQLQARLGSKGLLRAYLTLVPMGGNLQGLRAGSLAWFGKEPATLSDAEAAVLVALPQAPRQLRPDAAPDRALRARNRILSRGFQNRALSEDAMAAALATPLPTRRQALPALAPLLADDLKINTTSGDIQTTLDADLQRGVERQLGHALASLPQPVNVAAIVADWRTGVVLARAGSGDYFDFRRSGMLDMTRAIRSPGSTLKPFIYGMAFDGLLAHPATVVRDEAVRFDDYAPHNFDGGFNGDVTIRQALQASLNLPAVLTLQRLGPVAFTDAFKAAGLPLVFDAPTAAPGLPVALGGVGATLETLVTAYAALADGGRVKPLVEQNGLDAAALGPALLQKDGADAVVDILADMPAPEGFARRAGRIAYKTGTSYRFRDGWAIGFDGSRVIGVWMGRADGGSCTGCVGIAAAGLLFRLFDLSPPDPLPARSLAPVFRDPPPPSLVRLKPVVSAGPANGPRIVFPVAASRLLVDTPHDGIGVDAVKLTAEGGQKPYRWLVDGRPVESRPYARDTLWRPDAEGFTTLTVIDAANRSAETKIRIVTRPPT